jgi:phosphopantothenoylcysteine decarboxylase/phosphopantothenate--cysteine ligase
MKPGSKVLFGLGGGIAAFKAAEAARLLMERGAEVQAVMSAAAARFITPFSLENLTGRRVFSDLWAESPDGETHVRLGRWAEVLVIAPATMELLGKLALGLPDDALTCTAAACPAPLVLAPAMNSAMYAQPATQHNLDTLRERGALVVGPLHGRLASGDVGPGRMADPEDIADATAMALGRRGDLAGVRLLVTAGPTQEPLDPVRFLSNRSSGKMGYAIAVAARDRGADVTLVSGPVALRAPFGVAIVPVGTAAQMRGAVQAHAEQADAVIMAAAVADYRPAAVAAHKIKKGRAALALELERTDDILSSLATARLIKVGFAAETERLLEEGERKLREKDLDLLVANDVAGGAVFGADSNHVYIIDRAGRADEFGPAPKEHVAERILDALAPLLHKPSAVSHEPSASSPVPPVVPPPP